MSASRITDPTPITLSVFFFLVVTPRWHCLSLVSTALSAVVQQVANFAGALVHASSTERCCRLTYM